MEINAIYNEFSIFTDLFDNFKPFKKTSENSKFLISYNYTYSAKISGLVDPPIITKFSPYIKAKGLDLLLFIFIQPLYELISNYYNENTCNNSDSFFPCLDQPPRIIRNLYPSYSTKNITGVIT